MDLLPADRAEAMYQIQRWSVVVDDDRAWEHTAACPGTDVLRNQVVEVATSLARRRSASFYSLADDPWQDTAFATRMISAVTHLVGQLPASARPSAEETATLLLCPLLYDTLWSEMASRHRVLAPHNLNPSQDATSDRAAFERFALTFNQPRRRAIEAVQRGRWDVAEEIGWWLLHRWIGRRPEAYRAEAVAAILAEEGSPDPAPTGAGAWNADHPLLAALLRTMRSGSGFLGHSDRQGLLVAGGPGEMGPRSMAYLLAIARSLAIECVALGEVIGEHLGIADPVTPGDLAEVVREGTHWRIAESGFEFEATCRHPAVEVALRSHLDELNQVLSHAHRGGGSALGHLPVRATGDGVRPSQEGNQPAYHSAGVRFRLAEDRVRELLMGEQLYGDPKLAIRELYQNALDACRYREARTEYLSRTRGDDISWAGKITFEQGVDEEGRSYLDCRDNGVGMGIRELSEVFSQAGVRTADLPEFVEEQADWALLEPPIQLYPNSRFGIGVLSYFMLADEITVDTCRLGRDGQPGQRLRVAIAGPGSLFRIRAVEQDCASEAGTTVRLYLRPDGEKVSCVRVLRDLLRASDFLTEAISGTERHSWVPGTLSAANLPGDSEDSAHHWGTSAVGTPGGRVWWCPGQGAVLADGLWAGEKTFGAVVNLSRDLAPRLSVDRTRVLAYRQEDVDRLLWENVGELVERGGKILDDSWLHSLVHRRPLIADMVFEQAIAAGKGKRKWATAAGCFSQDNTSLYPDEVMAWRLTAMASGGKYRKILTAGPNWDRAVRARPSDALIMSRDLDRTAPWLDPVAPIPLAHIVRAAKRTGREPREVVERLEILGYEAAPGVDLIGVESDDHLITSRDLDGERPWLPVDEPVSVLHLLRVTDKTKRTLADVVARMRLLGYQVDIDCDRAPVERLEPDDTVIASRDLDGQSPWLAAQEEVAVLHVLRAARHTMRPPADIAARLAALGYEIAPECACLTGAAGELALLSRDLDGQAPWLSVSDPVAPYHLLKAFDVLGLGIEEIAAKMTAMGYSLALTEATLASLAKSAQERRSHDEAAVRTDDLTLLSRDLDGQAPWLSGDEEVPMVHILRAAKELSRSPAEIKDRLLALGQRVAIDVDALLVDGLEDDDLILVSRDLDEVPPWLSAEVTVPLAHIVHAANKTRRDVHDVAARLAVLGYGVTLECGSVSHEKFTTDDLMLVSRDLDSQGPWLERERPISLGHVILAAGRTRWTIAEVVARLETLGYHVDSRAGVLLAESVHPDDLTLISEDLDGKRPWLDPSIPTTLNHLVKAAKKVRRPMTEVAARMTALGYRVPDVQTLLPRWRPGGV